MNRFYNITIKTYLGSLLLVSVLTLCVTLIIATSNKGKFSDSSFEVNAQSGVCTEPFRSVATPLTDLGMNISERLTSTNPMTYTPNGQIGGLYPNGSNSRPPAHDAAGVNLASQIQPLDAQGNPSSSGKVGMTSIGMSNTNSEFSAFRGRANADPDKNPSLVIVNGAAGGGTVERWTDENDPRFDVYWDQLDDKISAAGLTDEQMQVVWVKITILERSNFPNNIEMFEDMLQELAVLLKSKFPNLKITYFSSRVRGYYHVRAATAEPASFDNAFGIRWLIERQINGDPALNFNPANGPTPVSYFAWGPYLWIDGENPRSDGRVWPASYLAGDCVHPSAAGNDAVADMLMEFFKSDTTATPWFLAPNTTPMPTPTSVTPTTVPTSGPSTTPAATNTPTPTGTPTRTPTQTPNAAPVATNSSYNAVVNTPVTIPLPYTDPDGPGPYAFLVITNPTNGTLSGTGNSRTYTPNNGYTGSDSFTWRVSDNMSQSNTATVTVTITNSDLTTGLVSHWAFESNTVNNTQGTCIGCANYGALWTTAGKVNGAFQLDGVNDYMNLAPFPYIDNAPSFSMSFWIKPGFSNTSTGTYYLMSNSSGMQFFYLPNINDWRFRLRTTTGNAIVDSQNVSWTANTWHHIGITYDGTTIRMYWDGTLTSTKPYTGTVYPTGTNNYIGATSAKTNYFPGTFDEFRVYSNRVLTNLEMQALAGE